MSFDQEDNRGGYGGGNSNATRKTSNPPRGDPDLDFTNKCQSIESTLYKLNSSVVSLTKMVDTFGGPRDSAELRHQFTQLKTTTMNSFHAVDKSIKELGNAATGKRRVQQDQLAKRFQTMLDQFRTCCQNAMQREKKQIAVERERADSLRRPLDDDDDANEHASMMEANRRREQEQQQMRAQMQFNQDMIVEREEGMKEIESTMTEINDIFRDLSMAVHDQGGMIDSIESNMTSADSHVDKGTEQLGKASEYQKKARSKMMCLLVIVAVVAAILVIVLVTQLKK